MQQDAKLRSTAFKLRSTRVHYRQLHSNYVQRVYIAVNYIPTKANPGCWYSSS